MSRCFPFPPPGYEKKARSDYVDELLKEKHIEKKHKKEKRDKEKREGKEKKGKDRSREKHREKKDRKEKHRDKVKNGISLERINEEKTNGHNEEKVGENSRGAEDVTNLKLTEELGRRIKDEKGGADQMVENAVGKVQRTVEAMGCAMEKERGASSEMVQNLNDTKRRMGAMGSNMLEEFDRRIRNGGAEIQDANKFTCKVETKIEVTGLKMEMERETGNEVSHYRMGTDRTRIGGIGSETGNGTDIANGMFQKFGAEQRKTDGLAQSMEKNAEKRIEGKEKTNGQEGVERARRRDGHKDRDSEKRSKGKKDKDRDKEKEKEKEKEKNKDSKREKNEHKHRKGDKLIEDAKKEQLDPLLLKPSIAPRSGASGDGNHKRKVINGFVHEIDTRPNKMPRPNSVSHLPMENGRKLDICYINSPRAFEGHEAINSIKVERELDDKKHKINGTIDARKPSVCLGRILVNTSENGESSIKPPHPDSKYLSQIYSVPQMDEWPESDGQEWLFGNDNLRKDPKTNLEADEVPQVWAEAVQIESADVLALPYVIPY